MKNANQTVAIATPKFKAVEQPMAEKAINFLLELRKKAVKEQICATHAVNALLDKYPDMSRPVVYKAAPYAGINQLTARNVWDARNHG